MLLVSNVKKSFNHRPVLKNVSFSIKKDETVVIMGKNGAGKSTLLRILARIMASDGGEISFQNGDLLKGLPSIRKNILYLGHAPAMYTALSAVENLKLAMQLRGMTISNSKIKEQLNQSGLFDQVDDPISIYSQGMLQRLKLTYAKLAHWDLLLMDEPFTGLDRDGIDLMYSAIKGWKNKEKSICMVLHNRERAEKYGDRILQLEDGIFLES